MGITYTTFSHACTLPTARAAAGATGEAGLSGDQGSPGTDASDGPTGMPGGDGLRGMTGPRGYAGNQGDSGAPGEDVKILVADGDQKLHTVECKLSSSGAAQLMIAIADSKMTCASKTGTPHGLEEDFVI